MSISRNNTWCEDLHAFLTSRMTAPFSWGKQDCCLFAADAVQVMTGHDYAKAFRGKYRSYRGARKVIGAHGGDLKTLLNDVLGAPQSKLNARRGDVVAVGNNDNPAAGIVFDGVWIAGPEGLINIPMYDILCAWRIG